MNRTLFLYFLLFFCINALLYFSISYFHALVPFNKIDYLATHRFVEDPRATGGGFEFFSSFVKHDSQWYFKIARDGYPYHPTNINLKDKKILDGLSYAYFPLYPLILYIVDIVFHNLKQTAFMVSIVFLVLNFFSLFFVIKSFLSYYMKLFCIVQELCGFIT